MANILAILSTLELIILTKFDEDGTKIVDFLLALYFLSSIIFFISLYRIASMLIKTEIFQIFQEFGLFSIILYLHVD